MRIFGLAGGGPLEAVKEAQELGLSAAQFFTAAPQQFSTSMEETFAIKDEFRAINITKVSHASLMSNLASEKPRTRTFSVNTLAAEMKRCGVLGIDYIVAHPGSSLDEHAIEALALSLKALKERMDGYGKPFVKNLCIETMAGSGNQLMSTPEEYKKLFDLYPDEHIKICIDTAHIWGAGYTPLEFWEKLKEYNLTDRVKVVHFNNTLSKKASKKERHAELSQGVIPQADLMAFISVLPEDVILIEEQPKNSDIPKTVEYLKESLG